MESIFSFVFAQRKQTIADETHFCDPEILDKILKNTVREIMSSFLQTCFFDFCSVFLCRQEVLNWNMYCLFALCSIHSPHTCMLILNSASHALMCAYVHKHADVHTHTYTHAYTHTHTCTNTHTHTRTRTQTVFDTLDWKVFLDARERSNPFEIIKGVIFQNRLMLVYAIQYSGLQYSLGCMCILHFSIRHHNYIIIICSLPVVCLVYTA